MKRYLPTLAVATMIAYLSFFKPPQPPSEFDIPYLDKLVHCCMYSGLSGMAWLDCLRGRWQMPMRGGAGVAVAFPLLYGAMIEVLQSTLTTYRGGSWGDFAANATGVLLAFVAVRYVIKPRVA